ncbi:NfeD family protein [Aquincola sp. J276]|uniref:NfeD family protein n=1 Tax=Aquincola sp. J276 TaxID=2898432 RepID=UPI002150C0D3|nr:NfeD family protein [Aquincola sp. J276]MCR5867397.1 NfeD family protein [Aquincola sp. J276]
MDWNAPTLWWLIAGLLVAVELVTTTFYLLMMALGAVAGALAAHLGLGLNLQVAIAALVGGGAVAVWHLVRRRRRAVAAGDAELQLDVGAQVQVPAWQPDGQARLSYRGSTWSARYVGSGAALPGPHVIRGVQGSLLLLDRLPG